MDVPAQHLDRAFDEALIRGAVLRTDVQFTSGTKPKYLIVLNHDPHDADSLVFLTTSHVAFYDKHPQVDHIRVRAGELSCFPVETVINCREVEVFSRAALKVKYRRQLLDFRGQLPQPLLDNIDRFVVNSRVIPLRFKRLIMGWP